MVYRYAIHGIQQDGGTGPYQKVRKRNTTNYY